MLLCHSELVEESQTCTQECALRSFDRLRMTIVFVFKANEANEAMSIIHQLSPELISKIAAGQVVERPVSVVKELVEIALDAHARNIDILLEDGGLKSIRVRDDGEGMSAEDVALAVLPHTTSKIGSVD